MNKLSAGEAGKYNNSNPGTQLIQMGSRMKEVEDRGLYFIEIAVTADGTGGISTTAPFACEVLDIIVQARAASGSGTLKLTDGTNDISDTIACAVDKTMARAGTIDDAYSSLAEGATLSAVANGGTDRGLMTVVVKRT